MRLMLIISLWVNMVCFLIIHVKTQDCIRVSKMYARLGKMIEAARDLNTEREAMEHKLAEGK